MKRLFLLSSLAALCAGNATMAAPPRDPGLQMIAIDVEGSGGTLFVTPEGRSLLIDTGNPPNPRAVGKDTADRLADTIHSFGVTRVDYLIITHYHSDHVGGFPAFLEKMPVGTVIDHGENRQPDPPPGSAPPPGRANAAGRGNGRPRLTTQGYYERYIKALGNHKHIVAKPGMTLAIGSMRVTFVAADGRVIAKPLPGAGQPNPACEGLPGMTDTGGGTSSLSQVSLGRSTLVIPRASSPSFARLAMTRRVRSVEMRHSMPRRVPPRPQRPPRSAVSSGVLSSR